MTRKAACADPMMACHVRIAIHPFGFRSMNKPEHRIHSPLRFSRDGSRSSDVEIGSPSSNSSPLSKEERPGGLPLHSFPTRTPTT